MNDVLVFVLPFAMNFHELVVCFHDSFQEIEAFFLSLLIFKLVNFYHFTFMYFIIINRLAKGLYYSPYMYDDGTDGNVDDENEEAITS